MKIDLHIHTQALKKGESDTRNISPEDFVKKMRRNDIGLLAITNHNKFDLDEHLDILEIDSNLKLFPGIELDVKNNQEHYHIIIVSNPKIKDKFKKIFDGEEERDYDNYSLDYKDFISKVKLFDTSEIVIIPHFADKDRAIGYDFLKGPKTDLNEYVTILEPAKLHTMGMVNAHGHLSLIGSDLQNWDDYHKEAIPELKFEIENFEKFHELCKETESFIKKAIDKTNVYNINETNLNGLPIYEDLNVVFGEKGSGKTVLLKDYLYPFFNNIGKKTYLHEGKEYSNIYSQLILNLENNVKIDKQKKNILRH